MPLDTRLASAKAALDAYAAEKAAEQSPAELRCPVCGKVVPRLVTRGASQPGDFVDVCAACLAATDGGGKAK